MKHNPWKPGCLLDPISQPESRWQNCYNTLCQRCRVPLAGFALIHSRWENKPGSVASLLGKTLHQKLATIHIVLVLHTCNKTAGNPCSEVTCFCGHPKRFLQKRLVSLRCNFAGIWLLGNCITVCCSCNVILRHLQYRPFGKCNMLHYIMLLP